MGEALEEWKEEDSHPNPSMRDLTRRILPPNPALSLPSKGPWSSILPSTLTTRAKPQVFHIRSEG